MRLTRYGITLKRLTLDDLELLRSWRNSEDVNQYMEYRDYITPEMQHQWFHSINNPDNFYYIIIHNGKKIGMINEKGFDRFGSKTTESGIFLGDQSYRNTYIPLFASLILLEMSFYFLGGKESYIHILKDNQDSIRYNSMLGYRLCQGQEEIENQLYRLDRNSFLDNTKKIRKLAIKSGGGDKNFYLIWDPVDYQSGMAQESEALISRSVLPLKDHWEEGSHYFYLEVDPVNPPLLDVDPTEVTPYKYFQKD